MTSSNYQRRQQASEHTVSRHVSFIENTSDYQQDKTEKLVDTLIAVSDSIRYVLSPRMRLEVAKIDLMATIDACTKLGTVPNDGNIQFFSGYNNEGDSYTACSVIHMPQYENNPSMIYMLNNVTGEDVLGINSKVHETTDLRLAAILRDMNHLAIEALTGIQDSST
ncbi:MAG: hypothetical protein WCO19_00805 [Candidatus Saccharibacteria bacterium]